MNKRVNSSKKRPQQASEVCAAYDIKDARAECKKRKLQTKEALAYMSEGRVVFTFSEHARTLDVDSLYQRWVRESEFGDHLLKRLGGSSNAKPPSHYLRCLVCSQGDSWEVWEEMEVCRALCNPGLPSGEGWSFLPIENTIFDPDRRDSVWANASETLVADRCLGFADRVLHDAARLYLLAVQLVPGFQSAHETLDNADSWQPRATPLARLIRDSKQAALRLMEASLSLAAKIRVQDEGIALRQGFVMGSWLAQAEAIITNAKAAALVAASGAGRPQSKFWEWVNSEPQFVGKSAKEVWPLLGEYDDPDHPGKKLVLKDGRVRRGNGEILREASFTARFKKRRGSIFQRYA